MTEPLQVRPLTPDRWDDLEALFGPRGAVAGCWCMWWRQTAREFELNAGEANREALRALVDAGRVPGLLAYRGGRAVGWVSVAPRKEFGRLERSRALGRVDEQPVWSIVCFFVDKEARGKGVSEKLLKGAMDYARSQGATLLEAYPVDKDEPSQPDFMWFGAKTMYDRAGFREVARRKENRPVVRKAIRPRTRKVVSR